MITLMERFSDKLMTHLQGIGWGPYDIWLRFKDLPKEDRLSEQYIYAICRGDKAPKDDDVLEKLASVEGLGLDYGTLKAWQLITLYPIDVVSTVQQELEKIMEGHVAK